MAESAVVETEPVDLTRSQILLAREFLREGVVPPDKIAILLRISRSELQGHPEIAPYFELKTGRPPRVFTDEERRQARALARAGWGVHRVARFLGTRVDSVRKHLGAEMEEAKGQLAIAAQSVVLNAIRRNDAKVALRVLQQVEAGSWSLSAEPRYEEKEAMLDDLLGPNVE